MGHIVDLSSERNSNLSKVINKMFSLLKYSNVYDYLIYSFQSE